MKTLKLKDKIAALQRTFPKIDPDTRFLYAEKIKRRAKANAVAVHVIAWSADGRVSIHKTEFRRPGQTMTQWAQWLHSHAGPVLDNQVRAYMNRAFGSNWKIHKIFGWHFVD